MNVFNALFKVGDNNNNDDDDDDEPVADKRCVDEVGIVGVDLVFDSELVESIFETVSSKEFSIVS